MTVPDAYPRREPAVPIASSPPTSLMGSSPRLLRWLWAAFLTITLAATVVAVERKLGAPLPQRLTVQPAAPHAFAQEVQGTGTVEAQVVSVTFPVPGRVAGIEVLAGQQVRQAQQLATLEDSLQRQNVAGLQRTSQDGRIRTLAERTRHASVLAELGLNLRKAQADLQAAQQLYDIGGLPHQDLLAAIIAVSQIRLSLDQEQATATSNMANLEQQSTIAQQNLEQAKENLSNSALRSPVDGVVVRVGLTRGVPSGSDTIDIVKNATAKVRIDLPEASSDDVRVGNPVEIHLAAGEQPVHGVVERVGVVANSSSTGNAVVPVYVHLQRPPPTLKSGLSVDATITTLILRQAVTVPLEAIVQEDDPQNRAAGGAASQGSWIWIVDQHSVLQKHAVTILARNINEAAIGNVRPGELIVRSPQDTFRSGIKVEVSRAN